MAHPRHLAEKLGSPDKRLDPRLGHASLRRVRFSHGFRIMHAHSSPFSSALPGEHGHRLSSSQQLDESRKPANAPTPTTFSTSWPSHSCRLSTCRRPPLPPPATPGLQLWKSSPSSAKITAGSSCDRSAMLNLLRRDSITAIRHADALTPTWSIAILAQTRGGHWLWPIPSLASVGVT